MTSEPLRIAAGRLARRYGFRSRFELAHELERIRRRADRRRQHLGAAAKTRSSAILNRLRLGDSLAEAGTTPMEVADLALNGWTYGQTDEQALRPAAARARKRLNSQPNRRQPDVHVDYALRALLMTFESGTGQRATASGDEGAFGHASAAISFLLDAWPFAIGTAPPKSAWLRQRIASILHDLHSQE